MTNNTEKSMIKCMICKRLCFKNGLEREECKRSQRILVFCFTCKQKRDSKSGKACKSPLRIGKQDGEAFNMGEAFIFFVMFQQIWEEMEQKNKIEKEKRRKIEVHHPYTKYHAKDIVHKSKMM